MSASEEALHRLREEADAWEQSDSAYQAAFDRRRRAMVRAVREDGLSQQQVGAAFGVSRQAVSKVIDAAS